MTKEENQNLENNVSKKREDKSDEIDESIQNVEDEKKEEQIQKSPEEKLFEIEDKLTRTLAEMENQRRRFEREKQEAFEYGGFAFAKEALSLIDNLERSKQILENDETIKNSEALKKTLEHLKIINQDLLSIFSKNNINPIDSLNKKLDPNYHQAMMEIEDDKKEPGTIVQEIQKGFTIGDRLLRPSLVGVSKKSGNKDQKVKENKENTNQK
tara:strand:- start:691 stop:1326 length:636 start_codon:yes stop_codon:yes gene_type:complete